MVHYTRKPASHRICGATGVRLNGVRRSHSVGCLSSNKVLKVPQRRCDCCLAASSKFVCLLLLAGCLHEGEAC